MNRVAEADVFPPHHKPEDIPLSQTQPASSDLSLVFDREGGRVVAVAGASRQRKLTLLDDVTVRSSDAFKIGSVTYFADELLSQPIGFHTHFGSVHATLMATLLLRTSLCENQSPSQIDRP